MKTKLILRIVLLSDATFGRGDGLAGIVDTEVEHDPRTGLPYIRGRTLKGLLVEECSNILFAYQQQKLEHLSDFEEAAEFLFGLAGSGLTGTSSMQVGPGLLPAKLSKEIAFELEKKPARLHPIDILESLTGIRHQTAMDDGSGAPDENSLRSVRVVLRNLEFESNLIFDQTPNEYAYGLLAACVKGLHRGGSGRNRGRGRLQAFLWTPTHQDCTQDHYNFFKTIVIGREP